MQSTEHPQNPVQQENQRKNLRAPLIVQKIPCKNQRKTFFGYAKNISASGLFIATVNPREPGERFVLELPLPNLKTGSLHCECEVIWKRHFDKKSPYEPGMGLKFIDLPTCHEKQIQKWVQEGPPTGKQEFRTDCDW